MKKVCVDGQWYKKVIDNSLSCKKCCFYKENEAKLCQCVKPKECDTGCASELSHWEKIQDENFY